MLGKARQKYNAPEKSVKKRIEHNPRQNKLNKNSIYLAYV